MCFAIDQTSGYSLIIKTNVEIEGNSFYKYQNTMNRFPSHVIPEFSSLTFSFQTLDIWNIKFTKQLWMYGVTAEGASVSIHIPDFKPTLLLDIPQQWKAVRTDEYDEILSMFIEEKNEEFRKFEWEDDWIWEATFVQATPFIGFSNKRKDTLIKLVCRDMNTFYKLRKHFQGQCYHHDFDFRNQFLQQTGLSYQSWCSIPRKDLVTHAMQHTSTTFEARTTQSNIKELGQLSIRPNFKKCFLRMKCVSRDGVVEAKHSFHPDPSRKADRVMAIVLLYVWEHTYPEQTFLLTTFPEATSDNNVEVLRCSSESDLLKQCQQHIYTQDPDDIFYFPDYIDTIMYLAKRMRHHKLTKVMKWERIQKDGMSQAIIIKEKLCKVVVHTRNMIDMVAGLKKKVFVPVESYDLQTITHCKGFLSQPLSKKDYTWSDRDTNQLIDQGVDGRCQILNHLVQECQYMKNIAKDGGMRLEFANISRVSDTDITSVVSRGEQIRVFNKLVHFCLDNGLYVNSARVTEKPLLFSIKTHPPTYQDPPERALIRQLRQESNEYLLEKQSYHPKTITKRKTLYTCQFLGEDQDNDEDFSDDEEAEGGNVMKPCCRFWADTRIGVLDFKSLYPTIMMAFNISYENLVFDAEYMDVPGVSYIMVPINKSETVAIACQPGIIPKLLELWVRSRDEIKEKLHAETDTFLRARYDKEQLSMKTLCNATYGFCGAGQKSSILAIRAIMFVVTALGRYLQKYSADYVAQKYKIPSIYGDTDSIFVKVYHDPTLEHDMSAMVEDLARRYNMDMTWSTLCQKYEKWNLPTLSVKQQLNAIMYHIYEKLCDELTALYPKPVALEFENLADNVWMGWVKKHYCYRFWDPSNFTKWEKIKVTGMPEKKRDYTPWTRMILQNVRTMILTERLLEIEPLIRLELARLIEGKVYVDELKVSRSYKDPSKYKHSRQMHLQVVRKIENRTRWPMPRNSRIFFVVVQGKEKVYLRSETPEYVRKHNLTLDLMYYLQQQFYKPVRKLLTYHPELFNFEQLYRQHVQQLQTQLHGTVDIGQSLQHKTKRRKLCIAHMKPRQKIKNVLKPKIKLDKYANMFAKICSQTKK
jgi:DNA polymerase elongation subunit (family B)